MYKVTGGKTYQIGASIGSTDITIRLASFLEPISNIPYTMALIGSDIVYATIAPKTSSSEFISFTGIVQNTDGSATLTGVIRGLSRSAPFTSNITFKLPHSGGSSFVLSNSPQQINEFAALRNTNTFAEVQTFSQSPIVPTPSTSNQAATKGYVDTVAIAGAPDSSTTQKGIGKVSLAPVSPTNPIFVGDNDPRVPTQDENNALLGTSGPPSTTNRYVTNDDTVGTGAVQRASQLTPVSNTQISLTAGASIIAGQALHISPYVQSDGGVLLDNQITVVPGGVNNPTTSFTVENNTNRVLLVMTQCQSGGTTAVTYNGVGMTEIATIGSVVKVYKLVAPSTGANTLSITGTLVLSYAIASYYNIDQAINVEVLNSGNSSFTITSSTINSYLHVFGARYATSSGTMFFQNGINTKYTQNSVTSLNSFTTNSNYAALIANYGITNETQAITINDNLITGGAGTVIHYGFACFLKPVTTSYNVGVLKTNTTQALLNEPLIDFIGFANATTALGETCIVNTTGVITGLSGLTAGKKYYLKNTDGTIGTTRGTYGKLIGVALSTTTLLVQADKTMGAQISKTANYTYTAECDGFVKTDIANSGNVTIITDGVTNTVQASISGTITEPMTVPVSRGKTYIVATGGNNITFTPLA